MSTQPTLAALLRSRSRREVAAFVAALYDARGVPTRVDSNGVVIVDDARFLVVEAGLLARVRERIGTSVAVDTLVTVNPARAASFERRYDVPVVTPTDLDRLARYGLDRAVADRLFADAFDCHVADVAPTSRTDEDHTARSTASLVPPAPAPAGVSQSAVVAVLLVAALVAFAAAASPSVGPELLSGTDDLSGSDAGEPGAAADEAGVANQPRPTTTPVSDRLTLAPGLSIDGVVDAEALATAHATRLANRSYTWELTYVEFSNGNESGRATETVTVETPTVYASHVTTDGFLGSRGPVSFRSSYADGERRYRPIASGVDSTPIEQRGTTGLQGARASQYYSILLDGENTSVVQTILGEPRLYVVNIEGAGTSTVRDYSATAHVAPDGIITYFSGSYCYVSLRSDDARETCLSLTMQYRNVGQTTVKPPAWYTASSAPTTPTTPPTSSPDPTAEPMTPTTESTVRTNTTPSTPTPSAAA